MTVQIFRRVAPGRKKARTRSLLSVRAFLWWASCFSSRHGPCISQVQCCGRRAPTARFSD